MIVVDTNVISEVLKPHPDELVQRWLQSEPIDNVYVTSITKAELLYGLALLPDGRRKEALASAIQRFFFERVAHPVIAFSDEDVLHYAPISAYRRRIGRPIRELDGQIAAITKSRGFAVATRNVRDFQHCGIQVINPWEPLR